MKEGERGVWGIRGKPGVNGRRGDTEKRRPGGMREREKEKFCWVWSNQMGPMVFNIFTKVSLNSFIWKLENW